MQVSEKLQRYWQKNLRITSILMFSCFVVTFVVAYYARELNFNFFGWPFSWWVAAQGALVVYVLIIGYYAYYMLQICLAQQSLFLFDGFRFPHFWQQIEEIIDQYAVWGNRPATTVFQV